MAKLSPDGRRIRTIIIATPFLVASSILLYKRLFLGEEQKRLPRPVQHVANNRGPFKDDDDLSTIRARTSAANETGEWKGVPEDVKRRIQMAEEGAHEAGRRV